MKKLVTFIVSLAFAGMVSAQSSRAGGGLSTKAIQALEACFDAFDNFTCAPTSGTSTTGVVNPPGGTVDTVAKWTAATVLGDSTITDDGSTIALNSSEIILGGTARGDSGSIAIDTSGLNAGLIEFEGFVENDFEIFLTAVNSNVDTTATLPNLNITIAGINAVQSWTAEQRFIDDTRIAFGTGLDAHVNYDSASNTFQLSGLIGAKVLVTTSGTTTIRGDTIEMRDPATNEVLGEILEKPIAGASGTLMSIERVINAMDGSDTVIGLDLATTNANHTGVGNVLTVLNVANLFGDAQAREEAIRTGTGFDYHMVNAVLSASPPDPATNEVGFFIDEDTDRVGGGAADCVLIARLSDGTEINVAILVTDGGCP